MKLVRDWLKELPLNYRQEAINAHYKQNKHCEIKVGSMDKALFYAFDWDNTPVTTKSQWEYLHKSYKKTIDVVKNFKSIIETSSGIIITIESNKKNKCENYTKVLNDIIRLESVMFDEGVVINGINN